MKKTIFILDKIIKSITLIIIIFVVSVLLIGAMPRTKKNYSLEHENSISEYYDAKDVQKIISPNNDIRFIVFVDEIEKDKLISLTKSLAIKLSVNRLYVMFIDEKEESLVVIIDSNNDAYVEMKVE